MVSYGEEAAGGGEALFGCKREREVPDAERVRGVVGGVAPAHLPLHQLLRSPHRRGLLRRRHFDDLWSFFGSWGPVSRLSREANLSGGVLLLVNGPVDRKQKKHGSGIIWARDGTSEVLSPS